MSNGTEMSGAWQTNSGGKNGSETAIEFLRLKDGESVDIRITGTGLPRDIWRHRFLLVGKPYYAACPGKKECPACQGGQKLEHVNAALVIDRRDKKVKIWEFSNEKRDDISVLVKKPNYGDPRNYDLNITRRGVQLNTRYTVIPGDNRTPMEAGEKALLLPNLDEYYKPNLERLQTLLKGEVPKRKTPEGQPVGATMDSSISSAPNPLSDGEGAPV